MGKGDKKTRRGKITMGSHGKLRPRKKSGTEAGIKPEAGSEKEEKAKKS